MFSEIENKTRGMSLELKIKQLQIACAKFYTKEYFMHRVLNATLPDNDRTKLHTLGTFRYLLFDYIGQRFKDKS